MDRQELIAFLQDHLTVDVRLDTEQHFGRRELRVKVSIRLADLPDGSSIDICKDTGSIQLHEGGTF